MFKKLLEKSTAIFDHPWLTTGIFLIITIVFIWAIPNVKIDNDITNMLPRKNLSRKTFDVYEEIFGYSSLIFVGIESRDIFDSKTFNFVKEVTEKIEALNSVIPQNNLKELLGVSKDEAVLLIQIISEIGDSDMDELKSALTSKDVLVDEYFWEEKDAQSISEKMENTSIDRLLSAYMLPISEVNSIANTDYIKGKDGKFIVEPLYDASLPEKQAIEQVKRRIDSWDLYRGGIVSYDDTLTAIMIQLNSFDLETRTGVYRNVRKILTEERPEGIDVYLNGDSVIADSISEYMMHDMKVLIPIVFLIIVLALFLSFRNFLGVIFPLLAVIVSTIWAIGLMTYMKIPLNMISTILPVLMVAVGSAYGIHFMNHYFLSDTAGKKEVIVKNTTGVGLAISMAALTTVAGFGSLLATGFVPIRHFGIFTAAGIFFALLTTLYLIPSLMLMKKGKKPSYNKYKKTSGAINSLLQLISALGKKHYRAILILSLILLFSSAAGILLLNVEMNSITFFRKDTAIYKSDEILNKKLAGTMVLNIILEKEDRSPVITPDILAYLERFQTEVKEKFPHVTKTIAVTNFLKKLNQEMYGGDIKHYTLPGEIEKINDYMLLYSGNLDTVLTDERDKLKLTLAMKRVSTKETLKVEKFTHEFFNDKFLEKNGVKLIITGVADVYIVINHLITSGQILSLLISLLVVFLLVFLVFKSLLLSLISLIPIVLSLTINFGLMGYLKIPLNAGTAMVASIAIGIGIDYAIHLIVKFKKEIQKSLDIDNAIEITIKETGRGILYNMFSVIAGFLVLTFSRFVPIVHFGALVSLCMITAGFGALIIIPAALRIAGQNNKRFIKMLIGGKDEK